MDIRKRILKGETKRLASRVLSEENADKVADFIFEDENTDENKQEIKINESNNYNEQNDSNITSKIDSWLAEKEKKIEQEETPNPVTDLEDMEERIDDLNSELDETED